MAGHDEGDGVAPVRRADRAGGRRPSEAVGQLAVGDGLAVGDAGEGGPDSLLEVRALQAERYVEYGAFAREVLAELVGGVCEARVVALAREWGVGGEAQAGQVVLIARSRRRSTL